MSILRILLWITGVVIAAFVMLSSNVIANQVKNPAAAYRLGFPPIGVATAKLAVASFATRQHDDPRAKVSARERVLATAAYRKEPLSSDALGLLIAAKEAHPASGEVPALLRLAARLTRRNSMITSASIAAAATQGKDAEAFRWLSRAILTNEALRSSYIGAMAQATARPDAAAALAPVIGPNPSWSDRYWRAVVSVPASLANAAKLRIIIAGAPWNQAKVSEIDSRLVMALVRNRDFANAFGLYQTFVSPKTKANVKAGANADQRIQLPPFDWELATSGTMGSSLDKQRQGISISAISGARGFAARKLVSLSSGNYALKWTMTSATPVAPSALSIRISCAEAKPEPAAPVSIPLLSGTHVVPVNLARNECRWYWLSIDADLPDGSSGLDVSLADIALVPTTGDIIDTGTDPKIN